MARFENGNEKLISQAHETYLAGVRARTELALTLIDTVLVVPSTHGLRRWIANVPEVAPSLLKVYKYFELCFARMKTLRTFFNC